MRCSVARGGVGGALVMVLLAVLAVALPLGLADRIGRVLEGKPTVSFPDDPAGR